MNSIYRDRCLCRRNFNAYKTGRKYSSHVGYASVFSSAAVCGYRALVLYNQSNFKFDKNDYKNLNDNSKTLVGYFSRMNYTKKIVYTKANEEGAKILGLKATERTEGVLGFWWCGRFGMYKWQMPTLPLEVDLKDYEKIILVTPIWVFKMCATMRDFIVKNQDVLKTKQVEIVFNHFNPWLSKGAVAELNQYFSAEKIESKTTMLGHIF